ncbi:hypothetical protein YDYSG_42490 [Paenibacillus tyrfis]|uniref:cadmium resistance transporter n=1 Tax=Paenibacillus tyrfis TaxID=1501230 RepID=UPI00283D37AA|nr:hypothetical protein YDYSG_42490 [Paenibacillus tyrfis]
MTIGNGGDNIGVYIPLFASSYVIQIITILIIFAVLIAVWLLVSNKLTTHPLIAKGLEKYSSHRSSNCLDLAWNLYH